jgi:hypothetical protein
LNPIGILFNLYIAAIALTLGVMIGPLAALITLGIGLVLLLVAAS